MVSWIQEQFASNEFFAGFIGAGVLGWISWFGRNVPKHIYSWVQSKFGFVYEINSSTRENLYKFLGWAKKENLFNRQKYQVFSAERGSMIGEVVVASREDSKKKTSFTGPAPASYWGIYKKLPYRLSLTITKNENGGWEYSATFLIWAVSKKWIKDFLAEMEELYAVRDSLKMYHRRYDYWEAKPLPYRGIDSVFVEDSTKREILCDVRKFAANKEIYDKIGAQFKRSYLFYGQPGTGKTSLSLALANLLGRNIYIVNLNSMTTDQELVDAWCGIPSGALILFEDIDAQNFKTNRSAKKSEDENGAVTISTNYLSFSCLLNCLDGAFQQNDQVIVLTTNHREELDDALLRRGRIDREFFIDLVSRETALEMVSFITNEKGDDLLEGAKKDGGYLPCVIQENCLRLINEK
jgi:hypothetical protein